MYLYRGGTGGTVGVGEVLGRAGVCIYTLERARKDWKKSESTNWSNSTTTTTLS